jgi:cardiolipin synthase (CMP-forming)
MFTIPNLISIVRLLLVPVLFLLAREHQPTAFLSVLTCSLLSDSIDGFIARRLKQVTEFGAQLDSWADLANYTSLPVCAWWLWPQIMTSEAPFITTVIVSYMGPVVAGVIKFGRLTSYHTWGAKITAVCMGVAAILMFGFHLMWPFRVCTALSVVAALEEMAITTVLVEWQVNVHSIVHAVRINRARRAAARADRGAGKMRAT